MSKEVQQQTRQQRKDSNGQAGARVADEGHENRKAYATRPAARGKPPVIDLESPQSSPGMSLPIILF